jgi:hypothetical protein|tara:strand:- start:881 stop:1009 length:129 start_codon:yes stop_codon:yes gene_type:complete
MVPAVAVRGAPLPVSDQDGGEAQGQLVDIDYINSTEITSGRV